jgi:acetyl-CoA carboxylase carboxyl transferase subunit beta
MGGVTASFATLGDLIIAEPKAMIGFAGARVLKGTTLQDLPKGFQTAEFLLDRGLIDRIIARHDMRAELGKILGYLTSRPPLEQNAPRNGHSPAHLNGHAAAHRNGHAQANGHVA